MQIGNRDFNFDRQTYVCGILNVTPDSFSDGGAYYSVESALRRSEKMIADGVDLIDIGGESTRPGFSMIPEEEELERVIPVIRELRKHFDIPLSLDTFHSLTASEGIKAGVNLINDITGLNPDIYNSRQSMGKIIAETGVPCVLMSNRQAEESEQITHAVCMDLQRCVNKALAEGIRRDRIILDPGIGFCKTTEENLRVLRDLKSITGMGYPVLLGASRKSVIGNTLKLPTEERLEGTLVTTVLAVLAGCAMVRVHDIKENVRTIKMAMAVRDCTDRI